MKGDWHCRQPDSVLHGRVRRKDMQYVETKVTQATQDPAGEWQGTCDEKSIEMCPQRRHPLSITSHGRTPKDGFVVMQPHRKCPPVINCWPEGSPALYLWKSHKGPLSVRISPKSCHSTGLDAAPMAWFGTTRLRDWPNLSRCHTPCAATHNHSGVTPLSSESQLCDLGYERYL